MGILADAVSVGEQLGIEGKEVVSEGDIEKLEGNTKRGQ